MVQFLSQGRASNMSEVDNLSDVYFQVFVRPSNHVSEDHFAHFGCLILTNCS